MADQLTDALEILLAACPYVRSTRDLATKVRVEFDRGYMLELYFRETTGQYSYTLIYGNQRLCGWDNAPHYPALPNAPHHFHTTTGQVESAPLNGRPAEDMRHVIEKLNAILRALLDAA